MYITFLCKGFCSLLTCMLRRVTDDHLIPAGSSSVMRGQWFALLSRGGWLHQSQHLLQTDDAPDQFHWQFWFYPVTYKLFYSSMIGKSNTVNIDHWPVSVWAWALLCHGRRSSWRYLRSWAHGPESCGRRWWDPPGRWAARDSETSEGILSGPGGLPPPDMCPPHTGRWEGLEVHAEEK